MLNIHYVGFNAYKQCPNNGKTVLPKLISKWTQFSQKLAADVECTFKNVIIKTDQNFLVYGFVNNSCDDSYMSIKYPVTPCASLATDNFLFISEGSQMWRSNFDGHWSKINFVSHENSESVLWDSKQIIKMCFVPSNQEIILLLSDGSVWKLLQDNKVSLLFSPILDKATDISCGFEHGLILTESGCVMSFGNGSHGQLGHGDLESSPEPLQVLGLGGLKMIKIAAGGWHSCAIADSGDLYVWGWNNFGQLTAIKDFSSETEGDGYGLMALPMLVDIDPNLEISVGDVACGTRHTVIMTENNELFSTGWNEYGQLGVEDDAIKKINKFSKVRLSLRKGKKILRCGPWSTLLCEEVSSAS